MGMTTPNQRHGAVYLPVMCGLKGNKIDVENSPMTLYLPSKMVWRGDVKWRKQWCL